MTYEERKIQAESDSYLKMAKSQGYVPSGCVLPGAMVMGLTQSQGDACKGCNEDRAKCGGRPK